jgi:hypothetical protein
VDYQAASGTVTFTAGQTAQTISLTVNGDRTSEPDETFQVQLSSPVGATISDGIGVITILNDEKALSSTTVASDLIDAPTLTLEQVKPILNAAVELWNDAGFNRLSPDRITVVITDLPDTLLAVTDGLTITIDETAAGYGWFVDSTPHNSAEYHQTRDGLVALPGSDAFNRMDLLTVLAHELGHLLGYDHTSGGLMSEELAVGRRKLDMAQSKLTFIDLPLDADGDYAGLKKRRAPFSR